jgi:hypothetical protein
LIKDSVRNAAKPGIKDMQMLKVIRILSSSDTALDRCMNAAATPENPASPIENSVIVDNVSTKRSGSNGSGMTMLSLNLVNEEYYGRP